MKILIGLGNPGRKFQKTRHNLGRSIVNNWKEKHDFPDFKLNKKFKTLVSKDTSREEKIILALPETYMNLSGKSVKSLTTKHKIKTINTWIIHDDIDIPLGKIRIVKNKGAAGHRGVQSIIDTMGTKNFIRFRIGIKPKTKDKEQKTRIRNLDEFVLRKFNKSEEKVLKKIIRESIKAIDMALKAGLEKAMQEYNK